MKENDKLTLLIQVGMAIMGTLARLLNKREVALRIGLVLSDVFVAGFTGILLFWLTRDMETEAGWVYALSGIAGWIGPKVLDKIMDLISKKTGIDLNGTVIEHKQDNNDQ